jgi:enoyl-[acyl-carrier protein] reductase I
MLKVDLRGKRAFIAGVGDDMGFGWAIAKQLKEAGADVIIGTWTPIVKIFTTSFENGKFDASRKLSNGDMLTFEKIYSLDAAFDTPDDVPADIRENKRYKDSSGYTIQEVAEAVKKDFGSIDILVHSLANAPEVKKPLLETSRKGYLAAMSNSTYSFVSLLSHFAPIMNPGSSALTITYLASQSVIPGYGGGMSSAKAALESDTKTLAYEVGRRYGIRVNAVSAGAYGSRAAKAIGFIEKMIDYSISNSPLQQAIQSEDVANACAFLASPLARAITGDVVYVDFGMHAMGLAVDSPTLCDLAPVA